MSKRKEDRVDGRAGDRGSAKADRRLARSTAKLERSIAKLEKRQQKLFDKRDALQAELDEIAVRLAELRPSPTVEQAAERLSDLQADAQASIAPVALDDAIVVPSAPSSTGIADLVLPGTPEAAETMATAELPHPDGSDAGYAYTGDLPGPDDAELPMPGGDIAALGDEGSTTGR